jgi:hypothetical protein
LMKKKNWYITFMLQPPRLSQTSDAGLGVIWNYTLLYIPICNWTIQPKTLTKGNSWQFELQIQHDRKA